MSRADSPSRHADRAEGSDRAAVPRDSPPRVESGPQRTPSHSSDFGYEARYVPGATLADRYRIVSPLGKGGMGEVYRAEDLKLGQTVALKFLPKSLAHNAEALARFTREVRLARQVSHPNVCRVFDIGEAEGQTFLTMEFVDGEDIASLMRRIGRLPADKALEIARQVCAGLAAAHEHGIVHRDLKPANIMLDGRGRARITDFGLAGLSADMRGDNARAGTPAYMSPEQFSGGEVTAKSDLYSLGLVMYEVFTGKRPYEAATFEEMARLREKSAPTAPSAHLKDIDPLVERVMLRCLEKNPAKRPASALQVAAALPGGDPLAAALAAGETPSPEMVAAAGENVGLRPATAWGCLLLIVVALAAAPVLSQKTQLMDIAPLPNPPEVLAAKARDMARDFGYTATPVDTASMFDIRWGYVGYVEQNDRSLTRWKNLSSGVPPTIMFWYRESPQFLSSATFDSLGGVDENDPPHTISGMCLLVLDTQGHLLTFVAVPPERDTSTEAATPPNWRMLFAAAGLDANHFKDTLPQWTPLVTSDTRVAWQGAWPGHPELPLRVEAAAYRGKPVYFNLVSAWTKPDRMQEDQGSTRASILNAIFLTALFSIVLSGIMMARSNIRSGRGDRRGAARLALLAFLLMWVGGILVVHHVPALPEFEVLVISTAWGLVAGAFSWVLYVALEPHVRRRWPNSLISWSRLLAGQMRDPVVGRDLVFGILAGAFWSVGHKVETLVPGWMGRAPTAPDLFAHGTLLGLRFLIGGLQLQIGIFVALSLFYFFAFFVIRLVLRKEWLAILVALLVVSILSALTDPDHPVLNATFHAVPWGIALLLLIRFGLLPLMMALCIHNILQVYPLTTHLSAWYAEPTLFVLTVILAAAIFGFYTSTAGKPLFGGISLDD
jgi:protein kinase-like protein